MAPSKGELLFAQQVRDAGLPEPVAELAFHAPGRRWRLDFAWPELLIGVEIEGGTYGRSRHTTGTGYAADLEKYNSATLHNWTVLRFTTKMVNDGTAIRQTQLALGAVA